MGRKRPGAVLGFWIVLGCVGQTAMGIDLTWSTLDYPGATDTVLHDISGSDIVGTWEDSNNVIHGFLYDGTTWTTLTYPGGFETNPTGICDGMIVGTYVDGGGEKRLFSYDGTTWSTLTIPGASGAELHMGGIDGDNTVGHYRFDGGFDPPWVTKGFLYDGTTGTDIGSWTIRTNRFDTTLYYATVNDISGSQVVGTLEYVNIGGFPATAKRWGMIYDGSSWSTLTHPDGWDTYFEGISGDNVVGYWRDATSKWHGLLYDGTTWTTLDYPGSNGAGAYGIDVDNVVGFYNDASGHHHGFLVTIPEPASLALAALGGLALVRRRRYAIGSQTYHDSAT